LSFTLSDQLQSLNKPEGRRSLTRIQRGIEKESLRITIDGKLAQTSHPMGLGSALTHPSITTDYSEALMEFITPVETSINKSLQTLEDIHSFVYQHLDEEILWSASMPCIMTGDDDIPVALYGSANVARMKTVYRLGLGHRYGRLMQTIAGIHYNFSMPQEFWQKAWETHGKPDTLSGYISARYLGLIRNFQRYSWLLVYLYGASPAVCASFLRGNDKHGLVPFDTKGRSLHGPYATSLRMGDLGYNSNAQKGLNICYNSLDNYIQTLSTAIRQPHPQYASIPCGQDGNYRQLNDALLQIENEFYSPIRPKRVAYSGETPLAALCRDGIEYIEVRCVDVSPFTAVGLDAQQIRFMDTFLLFCLLQDSPPCTEQEQEIMDYNLSAVVNRGREPGLMLKTCSSGEQPFKDLASTLLGSLDGIAELLDESFDGSDYRDTLKDQKAKALNPELTPSARVLREMRETDLPFFRLEMEYSKRWAEHFRESSLSTQTQEKLDEESRQSRIDQAEIERADSIDFSHYLADFYAQYEAL
jgi:glutamate--cysteine ligase